MDVCEFRHSEKGRKGVYGLGSLWRIVWCMVIGVIGAVKGRRCASHCFCSGFGHSGYSS